MLISCTVTSRLIYDFVFAYSKIRFSHVTDHLLFHSQDQAEIQSHKFEVGMKVELLHPQLNNHIYPATICNVYNSHYFLVEIDDLREPAERSVVRVGYHGNQVGIFPITWCQSQGIKLSLPRGNEMSGDISS